MSLLYPLVGLMTWIGSVVLPLTALLAAWKLAQMPRSRWIVHVLFAPCVVALELLCTLPLLWLIARGGDGPPGLALLPVFGVASTALVLLTYYGSLLAGAFEAWIRVAVKARRSAPD